MKRIKTNRCRCNKVKIKKLDDEFNSEMCLLCFEIVSYEQTSLEKSIQERKAKKKTIEIPKSDVLDKIKDIEIDKVYNCDVFDLIEKIPNKTIRLVVVDPPYGDDSGYGRDNKMILNNESYLINLKFLDAIYDKMSENSTLYIFSNHKFYIHIKEHAEKIGLKYVNLIIIVKNNIGMGYPFRNQYEVCLVFDKGEPKYYTKDFSNVIKMNHIKHTKDSHPHAKDDVLIRKIIMHSSEENDVVFDGFMGSFRTAISCIKENRRFIGSELDPKWHKEGVKKIEQERNKTKIKLKDNPKQEQINF
jgi:site-specific DNA-methyltransferase (adenine-specific)